MIIEDANVEGIEAELWELDEAAESLGFVRWQWEYTRATYDFLIEDKINKKEYMLRINARAVKGKLEDPHAELKLECAYIGKKTFPHGIDYENVPTAMLGGARAKIAELKKKLGKKRGEA